MAERKNIALPSVDELIRQAEETLKRLEEAEEERMADAQAIKKEKVNNEQEKASLR